LRVLATTVDAANRENIEVVPLKAKAGYRQGYADPEFIRKLPVFQLPILLSDRKYRMFQISGDSMLPIGDKSWVIGEFVQDWYRIKDRTPCVLLLREDGIVFKVVHNELRRRRRFVLHSLNPAYPPYEVEASDVLEIWQFCNYISSEVPEQQLHQDALYHQLERIENEVMVLKNALKEKQ
ncbi:MAG: S24 family peptidase, partial [Chitinophagales bacterium]|nr:S24 family peptidase [Chitinophagales bacterium]